MHADVVDVVPAAAHAVARDTGGAGEDGASGYGEAGRGDEDHCGYGPGGDRCVQRSTIPASGWSNPMDSRQDTQL